jgi:hypothetical protein
MTQLGADPTAAHADDGLRRAGSGAWKSPFLIGPALILLVVALVGTNRVGATQEEKHPAPFIKIGKNYVNIARISHIFDDPGQQLPPGSISIFFSGGSMDYMNLYGDDARVFRETIGPMTADLTPKATAEAAAPKKAAASTKKSGAPAAPPATKKAAPDAPPIGLLDPGD